jgi:hypothetical protein
VLYVASNLMTALGEVFGDFPEALVCPRYRVALLRPVDAIDVLDLHGQGAAMRIGALPSLATGAYPRTRTQEWARAINEDQPVAGTTVHGVYYAAAHTSGPALALWNTESMVEGVEDRGRPQDYALADVQMWGRVAVAAAKINLRPTLVSACPRCR